MGNIFKKISYSILANIISVIVSALMILVMPKVMTMKDYGIWHLFLFYFSYVGFFHFGWIDGIYLRYGGMYYEQLDRKTFSGQFALLFVLLLVESSLAFLIAYHTTGQEEYFSYIVKAVAIAGVFINIITFVNYILQLTGRIKEYAMNVVLQRVLFLVLIIITVFFESANYRYIIAASLLSYFLTALYAIYTIKDRVLTERANIKTSIKEAVTNISVGSKLMLANIASILILGIVRFGIANGWNVITFGKISLTLQLSNFLMVFISAVSVVMFPILKRINKNRLVEVYTLLRQVLSYLLLGLLLMYYPIKYIFGYWLPAYKESFVFMGYLLPFCVFESKMQMLVNTYLKSFREELTMLKINVYSVFIALLSTFVAVYIIHDLTCVLMAIVLNFVFRLFMAEYFIEKILSINTLKERLIELSVVICFISINYFQIRLGALIYLLVYLTYLYFNRNSVKLIINELRNKIISKQRGKSCL